MKARFFKFQIFFIGFSVCFGRDTFDTDTFPVCREEKLVLKLAPNDFLFCREEKLYFKMNTEIKMNTENK